MIIELFSVDMKTKGPKCRLCDKAIPIMSYGAAYVKVVKPNEAKASFICWDCAGKIIGEKVKEL